MESNGDYTTVTNSTFTWCGVSAGGNNVVITNNDFNSDDGAEIINFINSTNVTFTNNVVDGSEGSDVYDYLKGHNLMPVGFNSPLNCMELRILETGNPEEVISTLEMSMVLFNPIANSIVKGSNFLGRMDLLKREGEINVLPSHAKSC